MSLAHAGASGLAKNTVPDVCKTPSPAGPIPVPYPVIISMASDLKDGTKTVKVDGGNMAAVKGSQFSRCSGDEAGTAGGLVSSTNMKEAKWLLYSFDVKLEGKNACRLSDKMTMNHGNTVCLQGYTQAPVVLTEKDIKCAIKKCDRKHYEVEGEQKCSNLGSQKHACVQKELEKNQDPRAKGACEQSFDMSKDPPAPTTVRKGMARPDIVKGDPERDPRKINVYDAKFPCSDSVKAQDNKKHKGPMPSAPTKGEDFLQDPNAKEYNDYQKIAGKGEVKVLTPEDCKNVQC
ncbi:MAG: DUF4150 domain-containing protein [Candidatus Rokubacteria bacterium]|nr:DUF4150 domain-containing protein [Candidatus Rokubacteria bacterium]